MRPLLVILAILTLTAPVRTAGADDPAVGDDSVGLISAVEGDVRAVQNGTARELEAGDPVYRGDWIETQADSRARVILNDETELTIGPGSRVQLDEFVYEPGDDSGKVLVEMSVGLLRFTTGVLKSESYEVKTPVASIGVRGTIFEVLVLLNGATFLLVQQGIVQMQSLVASVMVPQGQYSGVPDGNEPPTKPGKPSDEEKDQFDPLEGPFASDVNRDLGQHRPRVPDGATIPRIPSGQHPKPPSIPSPSGGSKGPSIPKGPGGYGP